jgi:Sulfotransferase domain
MPLSVIGAGLGRTGGLSLKLALERLGLGPCHHMREVFQHPRLLRHWRDAAAGRPIDWEEVFAGYRSTVDWPSTHFWRELAATYPEAKVILTVRPEAAWWASFSRTIPPLLRRHAEVADPHVRGVLEMATSIVVEQEMGGRPDDETTALACYRRRIAEVTAKVAPGRLLVFDVAEGWAPLCGFLGLPTPDEPFPRTNSTEEFWDPSLPGRPPRPDPITKPDERR